MRLDAPSSGTVAERSARLAPSTREHLRLVPVTEASPAARRGWIGTLGNTLLEMPCAVWGAFDLALLTAGILVGYSLFVWIPNGNWVEVGWWQTACMACAVFVLAALVFGLYEHETLLRRSRLVARSVLTATSAILVTHLIVYLLMYSMHSRRVLFVAGAFYLLLGPTVRLLVCWCISHSSRRFLIVGTDRKSRLSPHGLGDGLSRRYQLVGYIATDAVEIGRRLGEHRVLGDIDDIERVCVEHDVHEVVVGPGPARNAYVLDRTLACLRLGCRVTNLSTFYEQVLSEVPVAHLEPQWFLFADLKHYRETQLITKRMFDVCCALTGLLLTLPFWPLIGLLVRLDSPGPVFYHQQRVGRNGRLFRLYKFRTMHLGSEPNGHVWAAPDDPRVTRVGWYLRKTRLDELPQFWNVLVGQMSVVGPRPERPGFVEQLSEQIRFYNERHLVKPGLTGWAQINYPYGASVEDARRKLQLDLWYIKHMSLEQDLVILLRTLGTVFLGSR